MHTLWSKPYVRDRRDSGIDQGSDGVGLCSASL
jgi:hypothetical protein